MHELRRHFGDGKLRFSEDHSLSDIESMLNSEEVVDEIDDSWKATLDKIRIDFDLNPERAEYLISRGFTRETLEFFEVGYSDQKHRIVIPVRNEAHHVIGFIGRATSDDIQPKYLYSKNFPRKSVLFNLQNAKKFNSVIVVEGSLDAIKIHQAGHGNVVATLGAAVTKEHLALLNRMFDKVVIFSDNDHAGFVMRDHVIEGCRSKELLIVEYDDDLKDPGQMNDDQISDHLSSAKNYFEWCS
jgi:DNA primase